MYNPGAFSPSTLIKFQLLGAQFSAWKYYIVLHTLCHSLVSQNSLTNLLISFSFPWTPCNVFFRPDTSLCDFRFGVTELVKLK